MTASKLGNPINRPENQALAEGKGCADVRRTEQQKPAPSGATYVPPSYDLNSKTPCSRPALHLVYPHRILLNFHLLYSPLNWGQPSISYAKFAKRADKNEPVETGVQSAFPHNELGRFHSISSRYTSDCGKPKRHIHWTGEIDPRTNLAWRIGLFNKDKKEILVNNLFTQYNLISDNLQTTEEIFSISEFQKITDFINKTPSVRARKKSVCLSASIEWTYVYCGIARLYSKT